MPRMMTIPRPLDLVEYASEIGIERRVAAMLRQDLAERETLLMKPVQQLLERRDVPRGQIERNIVLPDLGGTPSHSGVRQGRHGRFLRSARFPGGQPVSRQVRSR
jgi:hypothetical protein